MADVLEPHWRAHEEPVIQWDSFAENRYNQSTLGAQDEVKLAGDDWERLAAEEIELQEGRRLRVHGKER